MHHDSESFLQAMGWTLAATLLLAAPPRAMAAGANAGRDDTTQHELARHASGVAPAAERGRSLALLHDGNPVRGGPAPPRIDVDPDSLSSTLEPGQSETQTLSLNNLGGARLDWELYAGDGARLRRISPSGVVDCQTDPNLIVHDDGTVENGYSAGPEFGVTDVRYTDRFAPTQYPASFRAVCLAFITHGPTSLDFEVVVFDDDGPGGSPGTELGALAVTATDLAPSGSTEPMWTSVDISSLGITIDSGSVYIGARWAPPSPNVFLASDESTDNPPGFAGGYWWNNVNGFWMPIEDDAFPDYRSMMVRVRDEPIDCTLPLWVSVHPTAGSVPAGLFGQQVDVTFDAAGLAPGDYAGNLCFASNDPVRSVLPVPLSLTVEPLAAPALAFAPANLDFGDVTIGDTSAAIAATLANGGNADATGLTFDVSSADFVVDASNCGGMLAAGASCTVEVTFSPSATGAVSAMLTVSSSDGASAGIDLAGNGVESPNADLGVAIETTQDYLQPGHMADYLVTLDNGGPAMATGADIASVLSPQLDLDFASWLCVGPASSGCTPAGQGDLAETGLEVPAGGSVTWLLSAPVRWDAQGPVETSVTAAYPDDPNPANNSAMATNPVVVYRNGFEPYGTGSEILMMLDEQLTPSVVLTLDWPAPGNTGTVETVFAATPLPGAPNASDAAFRLERFGAGPLSWVRLVAIDDHGAEISGHWLPVTPGTELVLALADTLVGTGAEGDGDEVAGDGGEAAEAGAECNGVGGEANGGDAQRLRTVLLMARGGDLQLPLAATPDAYRLWSALPVTVTPLGN